MLNFFEYQKKARRATYLLLFLLIVATLIITAIVTLIVSLFLLDPVKDSKLVIFLWFFIPICIFSASWYKTHELSKNSAVWAKKLGAKRVNSKTSKHKERQLLNIVEEMAIATGLPTPASYILPKEVCINALTVGTELKDMAVIVTQGSLNILSRDELQALLAHEFSHIVHADTLINTRMTGILYGISMIFETGKWLMFYAPITSALSSSASNKNKNDNALNIRGQGKIFVLGFILMALGYLGISLTRLIKSAVCRKSKTLADISSVRYTRNPEAIVNVLKKIGGFETTTILLFTPYEGISHMTFYSCENPIYEFRYLSSHPPLSERILALNPKWDGRYTTVTPSFSAPQIDLKLITDKDHDLSQKTSGLASAFGAYFLHHQHIPQFEDIDTLSANMPSVWLTSIQNQSSILTTLFCLFLKPGHPALRQQWQLFTQYYPTSQEILGQLMLTRTELQDEHRLLLTTLALTNLSDLPKEVATDYLNILDQALRLETPPSVIDDCLFHLLESKIHSPMAQKNTSDDKNKAIDQAGQILFSFVVDQTALLEHQSVAFDAGTQIRALNKPYDQYITGVSFEEVKKALMVLNTLPPLSKPLWVHAVLAIMHSDGVISIKERTLMVAICHSIHNPLPSFLR